MRVAYLDCFSGISGDMFLGALLDAGVPLRVFEEAIAALDIGARLEAGQVMRGGLAATKADVIVGGEKDLPREVYLAQRRNAAPSGPAAPASAEAPAHHDDHSHEHDHGHPHPHVDEDGRAGHGPTPAHDAPDDAHGRNLGEIRRLIARAPLSARARERATRIFEVLGAAEARIHQVPVEQIHLHEVGSVDAIVDIVCAAVGSEALGVDEWGCSPINVGGGTVECAHGVIPIPAPATLEMLRQRQAPIFSSGIQKELATPTGAAILSVLADWFGPFPALTVQTAGYGAGYRDFPRQANVLRLTVGEKATQPNPVSADGTEPVAVLEANLDDLSPQVVGYVLERTLAAGALDVFTAPVQMKKNRPGLLLTVLCHPADRERLAGLLFAETTTLGVRMREDRRYCLARRHVVVNTPWGEVRLKQGSWHGAVTNCAPEYEDCRRIAKASGVPLKTVMQEALRLYLGGATPAESGKKS
jgi:hypothetical protein